MKPKMKFFKTLLVVLAAYVAGHGKANAEEYGKDLQLFRPLNWDEVKPSAIQLEAIVADGPKGLPYFEKSSNVLWIAGASYVWKWSLQDGGVARLELPTQRRGNFKLVYVDANQLLGMDFQSVWQFKFSVGEWRRLDGGVGPDCDIHQAVALVPAQNQSVYISTNCGIYLTQMKTGQMIKGLGVGFNARELSLINGAAALSPQSFAMAMDQKLMQLDVDGHRLKHSLLYQAKSKILGVVSYQENFWAWTTQAILVFDGKWTRKQVIPVSGSRKISSFAVGKHKHIVGFSDGNIEIMDLKLRKKWASLNRGFHAQHILLSWDDQWAILIREDELPRVFNVTNLR